MPSLIVERGPDRGRVIELAKGCRIVFGRDAVCDFVMSDPSCSRRHFGIAEKDGVWILKDLDSSHGTYLNGWRIKENPLHDGDTVAAGETLYSFVAEMAANRGLVGKVIAGYQVIDRIGRGGMGTVYRAKQVALDREVALKVLSSKYSANKTFINRFFKEAQAAARLNHPNVVQVYDVREEQGLYLISLELMGRGTVQDLATREGQLSIMRVLEIARDAARGLVYAEKKGIVHGDIKPDNLMINADDHIKISDLGLARDAGEVMSQGEEGIFGTPHFISPEQAQGKPVDSRSDIYSFGATLYRLISGHTPFSGASVREIILKQISEDPEDLRAKRPDCPQDLADLVAIAMAKDPADRFATAHELLDALIALGATGRLEKKRSNGAKIAMAAGVLVLLGGGFAAYLMTRPEPAPMDNGRADIPPTRPSSQPADDAATAAERAAFEQNRLELAVADRLYEAQKAYDEIKGEGRGDDIESLRQARQAFVDANDLGPSTTNAARAMEAVAAIDRHISDIEDARQRREEEAERRRAKADRDFADLERAVQGLVESGRYAQALVQAGSFQDALAGTHRGADAMALVDRIKEMARARADEALGNADRHLAENDFGAARNAVRDLVRGYAVDNGGAEGLEELARLAAPMHERLEQIDERERLKLEEDRKTDQGMLYRALSDYYTGMRASFDPEKWRREFDTTAAALHTPEARARLDRARAAFDRAADLQQSFIDRLQSNGASDIRLSGGRGVPSGKVISADRQALTVERSPGNQQTCAWSDLDPKVVYRTLLRRFADDARSKLDLAIYCLESGMLEDAARESEELKKLPAAGLENEVRAFLEDLALETEAARRVDEIRAMYAAAQNDSSLWFEVKRTLETFMKTFDRTRAFVLSSDGSTQLASGEQP